MNLAALGVLLWLGADPAPDGGSPLVPLPQNFTRPVLLTRPPHVPEGLYIRGRVMVKCRILVSGLLEGCEVVTFDGNPADPRLASVIQSWAASARLQPATSDGKPVE
ncbi:MAG TPA: hypothetical protein VLQ79_05810 [Myxococcaceae bacterium]|nr:hypothetical protein [Myxococcaceae bacterium]